jgi:5-methylcytosine-specific restriction enzyme subunit McrC
VSNHLNTITIYEYQSLRVGTVYGGVEFTENNRNELEKFYGRKGVPFYSLIHKGVKFNSFVGVLQLGTIIVEVLPKADKHSDVDRWRKTLIGMLRAVGAFNIKAPSSSSLSIKTNFILDLYFELFINELEYLMKIGLINKYRCEEGNRASLKGNLLFSKDLQKNLIHKERFFVRHTTYNKEHLLHIILYQCLLLLKHINSNRLLNSRIGQLLLDFPEMKTININVATFDKIVINRKTESYKNAIEIAQLLLLNYHPDLSRGRRHVLALMFDMNSLWEKFIYVSLRKFKPTAATISAQASKHFWKPEQGYNSSIRPDIVIKDLDSTYVIDTKWKNLGNQNPSPDDLRQLYVYHEYYEAKKVALAYPGNFGINRGSYYSTRDRNLSEKECSIITIPTRVTISEWQKNIAEQIFENWLQIDYRAEV